MDWMMTYQHTMWPGQCCPPMAAMPVERLEDMYPEIYRRVHPKIRRKCECEDVPGNPSMFPNPTRAAVERMTDEIYRETCAELGIGYDDDMCGCDKRQIGFGGFPGFGGFGFGRRRFLRDLISVLLIRELLFRRGRPF